MANRKDKLDNSQPLARRNLSLYEGVAGMVSPTTIPITRLPIFDIIPDPAQPRRVVPASVRRAWSGLPDDIETVLFPSWYEVCAAEIGQDVDYVRFVVRGLALGEGTPRTTEEQDRKPGSIEAGLLGVADLAASIHDNKGLINPITVVNQGDYHVIETGERRWLAYHLLNTLDAGKWFEIPARVMREASVWNQAYENNARDNLNAIAKARQLALLLMDLHRRAGAKFEPLQSFEHEQDFYAQVADGTVYSIPRNTGERVVGAMGVQNARQIRDYRRLLRLPREIWEAADDRNWREGRIRTLLEQAGGNDDLLLDLFEEELLREDNEDDYGASAVSEFDEPGDSVPTGKVHRKTRTRPKHPIISPYDRRNITRLMKLFEVFEEEDIPRLPPESRDGLHDLAAYLHEVAARCEMLLKQSRDRN